MCQGLQDGYPGGPAGQLDHDRRGFTQLVGGFEQPTPLKNDGVKVSWDDDIPNIYIYIYMEKKTNSSKPPTSQVLDFDKKSDLGLNVEPLGEF